MTLFSSHIQRPHVQKIIPGIEILRVQKSLNKLTPKFHRLDFSFFFPDETPFSDENSVKKVFILNPKYYFASIDSVLLRLLFSKGKSFQCIVYARSLQTNNTGFNKVVIALDMYE